MELTLDYEDLDPETLEDIEVSLYGMLHHAANEDDHHVSNTSVLPSGSNEDNEASPSPSPAVEKPTVKEQTSNEATPSSSKQKGTNGRRSKTPKTPKRTPQSATRPRRNPFTEYLVVERSDSNRESEVITLSDEEEDSRYETINKTSSKKTPKAANPRSVPPITSASSPVEQSDSSDEDNDSIVILDHLPESPSSSEEQGTLSLSDSETDSDSSDSDVEVIGSSNTPLIVDPVLRLNVNGSQQSNNDLALRRAGIPNRNNLNKELDRLGSCSKWTPEMVEFYARGEAHVDLDAIYRSLPKNGRWHLDDEDVSGLNGKQRNRYFAGRSRVRCANCQQWDHVTKNCPEPRKMPACGICGMPGHKTFGCPKKLCLGCGRTSRILVECCPDCRRERSAVCMICRLNHLTTQCPDLWRRYHMTTKPEEEPTPSAGPLKPSRLLYCSNCAERGHLAINCREMRWSKYPAVSPEVFSYQDSGRFLNEITDGGKKTIAMSNDRKSIWVVGNQPETGPSPKRGRNQKYYIPLESSAGNEGAIQSVKRMVLSEIKNVDINWRKQVKKKRVLVEFTGQGDTVEAKIRFRKMINFRMKKPIKGENPRDELDQSASEGNGKERSPKKKKPKITSVSIIHLNHESKEMRRRTARCDLTEKEKKNLGSLLSKMESRHRVRITSSVSDKTWEIVINNLQQQGNSSSAFYSIVRHLDAASARPAGV